MAYQGAKAKGGTEYSRKGRKSQVGQLLARAKRELLKAMARFRGPRRTNLIENPDFILVTEVTERLGPDRWHLISEMEPLVLVDPPGPEEMGADTDLDWLVKNFR